MGQPGSDPSVWWFIWTAIVGAFVIGFFAGLIITSLVLP